MKIRNLLLLTLCLISAILVLTPVGQAAYSSAAKAFSFYTMKVVSTTDSSGPAANGATWTAFNSGSVSINTPTGAGVLMIRFLGDGTAGQTLTWVLQAASEENEPFMTIAYGTTTVGLTTTGNSAGSGQFYCNTITMTAYNWPTGKVEATTGIQYNAGTGLVTNAGIALLAVDTFKWKKWKMQIVKGTATGGGAEFMHVTIP